MLLSQLTDTDSDLEITGISEDSRKCQDGYLFAALRGAELDGTEYIDDAVKNGAIAVLTYPDVNKDDLKVIHNDNPRKALGEIAARFYGKQPETIVAVTGTNGKTSVVNFCRQLWFLLGNQTASMGTLGVIENNDGYGGDESLTTPDSVTLHETLEQLAEKGINNLAIEASSHGLDQYRLSGVKVKVAAITNISRDHLDYHGSIEKYIKAKKLLFTDVLAENGIAVINADMDEYQDICASLEHKIISYGEKGEDFKLLKTKLTNKGQILTFTANGKEFKIETGLIGSFQASNLLCALAIVTASGADLEQAVETCNNLESIPGRMQRVAEHISGAPILVDYAHTPDALEKALQALKPHVENRLLVVFGCGGDRDKGKRPQMGEIAARLADIVVVTDDNPRNEDPNSIRSEIMAACADATEISDRKEAITYAINQLQQGDVLIIAGKGHENYQLVKGEKSHFDDAEVAREVI